MSVINMVKVIKEIYPTSVTLIKTGKFYQAYGKYFEEARVSRYLVIA